MKGHDLRLAIPALTAWLAAGVLLGLAPAIGYAVAATCAILAGVLLSGLWRRPGAALAGAALACASASAAGTALRLSAVASGPVRSLALVEARTAIEAVITTDPQQVTTRRGGMTLVRMRAEAIRVRGRMTRVRVPLLALSFPHDPPTSTPRADAPPTAPGTPGKPPDHGSAPGRPDGGGSPPTGPEGRGPGTSGSWTEVIPGQRVRFGAKLTSPRRGELLAAVAVIRGPPQIIGDPSWTQRAAAAVRARLRTATDGLPSTQRQVLPGMVVGDTSRLDPRLAEDFRTSGLSHLLVVSGANLALIVAVVLGICRLIGLGRLRAPPLAAVAVLAFVIVARPDPSVLRAMVMGLIGLLALLSGRERRGLPSLGAAVLFLVLLDPGLARSYGFALSVVATAGLLIIAPPWRERMSRRMPRPLAEVLAVAAAAQVACAPVLVMLSGDISLVAVLANLLAAPAVPVAVLLGSLAAALAPPAMPVARVLVRPAGLAAGWIAGVARTTAALPYATLPWREGAVGAAVLVAVGVAVALVVRRRRLRMFALAAAVGAIVTAIAMRVAAPGWPPAGWRMVVCDVGQGDAIALAAGPGSAVVVDAGPDPAPVDACLDRLGVRVVPLVVLTHPHADHVGGIAGVRDGRKVETVLGSAAGLRTRPAVAGQRWTVGELTLEVLGPPPGTPAVSPRTDTGTTVNNASVVLVARHGRFSALLPGDVETEAQRSLTAAVPPVDVLKVPHHGSRKQDPSFLAAAHAAISVTSVGAGNDYGHPAPTTMALLHRLRTDSYRTDQHGDIAIGTTPNGPTTTTRR